MTGRALPEARPLRHVPSCGAARAGPWHVAQGTSRRRAPAVRGIAPPHTHTHSQERPLVPQGTSPNARPHRYRKAMTLIIPIIKYIIVIKHTKISILSLISNSARLPQPGQPPRQQPRHRPRRLQLSISSLYSGTRSAIIYLL